jgi:putative tryptophan/tyrosine transport system substrate-binding protein
MDARRDALRRLGGCLGAPLAPWLWPAPALAALPRIGVLLSELPAQQQSRLGALEAGLRERGLIAGRTMQLELRSAKGRYDALPKLAAELVKLKVDVIVAFGIKALTAAASATRSIPIVVPATSSDLVALGYARSLGRPGGNVTGATTFGPEIMAKRLELIKELQPDLTRAVVLANAANQGLGAMREPLEAAARLLRVQVAIVEVRSADELGPVLAARAGDRVQAILVQDDTLFSGAVARSLAQLALKHRMLLAGSPALADAGAVAGYGRSDAELYKRGAYFVERILKGERPGDLPIEQATHFQLVLHSRHAAALGLSVPTSLTMRADRIVE